MITNIQFAAIGLVILGVLFGYIVLLKKVLITEQELQEEEDREQEARNRAWLAEHAKWKEKNGRAA